MHPEDRGESALIEGLAAGDAEAWRRFLEDHGRLVYAVARRFSLSEEDQEEVFQNTCLAVYRSIRTLKDPSRFSAWLYGIAYRLGIDVVRDRKRRREQDRFEDAVPEVVDPAPLPDRGIERLEVVAHVRDGLGRLDPRCRALLHALYVEDPPKSYLEVGEAFGMPLGSIGPTRLRCMEKLRKALEGVFPGLAEPTTGYSRGEGCGKRTRKERT